MIRGVRNFGTTTQQGEGLAGFHHVRKLVGFQKVLQDLLCGGCWGEGEGEDERARVGVSCKV